MSYRYMRIILFFDLPIESLENKREYRKFRKFLIKKGFLMLQESVYCKLALNQTVASNKPRDGLVQLIVITEKQFSKMEYICGENKSNIIDSDSKLVIL